MTTSNAFTAFPSLLILALLLSDCSSPVKPSSTEQIATMAASLSVSVREPEVREVDQIITGQLALTVIITNLQSATAPVSIAFYERKNKFLDKNERLKEYRFKPHDKTLTAQITDRAYGEYAIAIYQDVNSDGKYNKTFLGFPVEPYGFSNNYKPKLKAPSYNDCKFVYNADNQTIRMAMIRKKNR